MHILKALRKNRGLTQQALATRLCITQSRVSTVERGQRRLDVSELRTWLAALGSDLSSFGTSLDCALALTRDMHATLNVPGS